MNSDPKPHRKIFLKDMAVSLSIGIHDFEKLKRQNVLINIELDLDPNLRILEDTIAETVDYDFLRTSVVNLSNSAHFHPLERMTAPFSYNFAYI